MAALQEKEPPWPTGLDGHCFIHFAGKKGRETSLTVQSATKVFDYCHIWKNLDGKEQKVALEVLDKHPTLNNLNEDELKILGLWYHRNCYSIFCNKEHVSRAEKRKLKARETQLVVAEEKGLKPQTPSHHLLRSSIPSSSGSEAARNVHILPEICIICKKKDVYKMDKRSGKRTLAKLVLAETVDGGLLRKTAEAKKDENILLLIRDKDCVAIEVRYHRHCHLEYCRPLTRFEKADAQDPLYAKSYDNFCKSVIEEKLLKGKKILRMSKLHSLFLKTVNEVESMDASNYRPFSLKKRLQKTFPQLVFHKPHLRNQSQFVFLEELSQEMEPESDFDSDESELDYRDSKSGAHWQSVHLKDIYMVSMELRKAIREAPKRFCSNWPPTASDITSDNVSKIMPSLLYNFIAWTVGFSDEPCTSSCVSLSEELDVKVKSLCQDIIFVASKGKVQTPKSLSLSMAVRQLTRSTEMLKLLNGFGHSCSIGATLTYESDLARLAMKADCLVPKGFAKETFTTLVYDNDDFQEEAKNQTHITAGIIIQKESSFHEQEPSSFCKKGKRSVEAPPVNIPPYNLGKRKSPDFVDAGLLLLKESDHNHHQFYAGKIDFAYILMKFTQNPSQELLPGWTGFNMLLNGPVVPSVSHIGYLPIIDSAPTAFPTIFAILSQSLKIANELAVKYLVLVFDQAIYSKVQQIRWKNNSFKERFVIRLGDFHTVMSFCGVVAKRFRDAGLQDILIESNVIGQGSVKGVMSGKHYNRSIYCHKIFNDALHRLRFSAFLESLGANAEEIKLFGQRIRGHFPDTEFDQDIFGKELESIMDQYKSFVSHEAENNPTFAFWSSYIELTDLLLRFLRATREGNWNLHLSTLRSMLKWFFAYDHTNYSRYGTAYWLEMISLPQTHPGLNDEISKNWTVQRQERYGFSSVACDMTIEQTLNRDSKTKGGIIGITQNRGALHRWLLAQSERSAISRKCAEMAGIGQSKRNRKDLDQPQKTRNEKDVKSIESTLKNMINPFEFGRTELLHLSSGIVANATTLDDLRRAPDIGEGCLMDFISNRLLVDDPDIFSPIKMSKLKTFTSMQKTSKVRTTNGHEVALTSNRNLFARMLLLAKSRDVNMEEVLSFSLNPLPLSIATGTGALVKTQKSKLMTVLEDQVTDVIVESIPSGNALVVDGMAIIQTARNLPSTFGAFAEQIFITVKALAAHHCSHRVDFVIDRYPQNSIKDLERSRRASEGVTIIRVIAADQKLPAQWSKFLKHGQNKESLANFLFETWTSYPPCMFGSLDFFLCHEEFCHHVYSRADTPMLLVEEVPELFSDHEEADTRLLLHAKHASQNHSDVIIKSPDTDVFVLCVAKANEITGNLLFETGAKERNRIVSASAVSLGIGTDLSSALLGFHAFTGCDSTSSFYGKGKVRSWKLMKEDGQAVQAFSQLGKDFKVDDDLFVEVSRYTCSLYGVKERSVNTARYKLFKLGKFADEVLPPNEDCLRKHIQRANYQAAIWQRCTSQAVLNLPSPLNHGWLSLDDGSLGVHWMENRCAPDMILKNCFCKCKIGRCENMRCTCKKATNKCSELCQCIDCSNLCPQLDDLDEDEQTDSDSDISDSDLFE